MAVLPAEIPTGLITGQYYFVSEDNIDVDTDPELVVVSGTVDFVASVMTLTMPSKKAVVVPLKFQGKFDGQGNLVPVDGTGIGMKFPATNSDKFTERDWTWRVEYNLKVVATGFTVNIPGFDFQVPVGSTQDLSEVMPVASSPGVLTVRGPKGDNGLPGAGAITVSNVGGRSATFYDTVNARQQLFYGDTGWRDISALLVNGWTGTVRIRRTLYDVTLQIVTLSGAAATSGTFLTAPAGFQLGSASLGNFRGFVFQNNTPIVMRGVNISGAGALAITQYSTADNQLLGSFQWDTLEAWPTVLPGTGVGTIPNT